MKRILFLLLVLSAMNLQCTGKPSSSLGLRPDGTVNPCPASPNCVSSTADDSHYIESFSYHGTAAEAHSHLLVILRQQSRVHIAAETPRYIHVEFTSFFFRFVDDVEFIFDETNKKIYLRSASRLGYSDFGVNRRRLEKLRSLFEKEPENEGT